MGLLHHWAQRAVPSSFLSSSAAAAQGSRIHSTPAAPHLTPFNRIPTRASGFRPRAPTFPTSLPRQGGLRASCVRDGGRPTWAQHGISRTLQPTARSLNSEQLEKEVVGVAGGGGPGLDRGPAGRENPRRR